MKKNYLIVIAHPDDEILGAGATAYELSGRGDNVYVCCLCNECPTRFDSLENAMAKTHKIVGIKGAEIGNFKCLSFKDEPHHYMVMFVEDAIKKYQPDAIITHHPADLHHDHFITSMICQEASKLPQRQTGYTHPIESLLFMEVQSSTDWSLNRSYVRFSPNTYQQVSEEALSAKVEALKCYDKVIREDPFPRSERNIFALASVRGSEIGFMYAEAFQTVIRSSI